jgi:hypothetical protein
VWWRRLHNGSEEQLDDQVTYTLAALLEDAAPAPAS